MKTNLKTCKYCNGFVLETNEAKSKGVCIKCMVKIHRELIDIENKKLSQDKEEEEYIKFEQRWPGINDLI